MSGQVTLSLGLQQDAPVHREFLQQITITVFKVYLKKLIFYVHTYNVTKLQLQLISFVKQQLNMKIYLVLNFHNKIYLPVNGSLVQCNYLLQFSVSSYR